VGKTGGCGGGSYNISLHPDRFMAWNKAPQREDDRQGAIDVSMASLHINQHPILWYMLSVVATAPLDVLAAIPSGSTDGRYVTLLPWNGSDPVGTNDSGNNVRRIKQRGRSVIFRSQIGHRRTICLCASSHVLRNTDHWAGRPPYISNMDIGVCGIDILGFDIQSTE
jgi:hypothetical protein